MSASDTAIPQSRPYAYKKTRRTIYPPMILHITLADRQLDIGTSNLKPSIYPLSTLYLPSIYPLYPSIYPQEAFHFCL